MPAVNETIEQLSKWGPEWLLIFGLGIAIAWLVRYLLQQGRTDVEKMTASRVKLADGVRSLTSAIRSMGETVAGYGRRLERMEERIERWIAEKERDR